MKTTSKQRAEWRQLLETSPLFAIGRMNSLDLLADAERAEVLERALREIVKDLDYIECVILASAKAALGETT